MGIYNEKKGEGEPINIIVDQEITDMCVWIAHT